MTFKPGLWYPIAVTLTVINVAGFGYAVRAAEPWHAAVHAVLALALGFWAQRLRRGPGPTEREGEGEGEGEPRLEALEAEVSRLQEQLTETQERLDFAERMLAQRPESRRVEPRG